MTPLFVNTQTSKPKVKGKKKVIVFFNNLTKLFAHYLQGNFKRQEGLVRATNKDLAFSLTLDPGKNHLHGFLIIFFI